ncbi:hypothetical protein PNOK_0469900 [Pyrrhoderma noxium]|uniref:F-box domain-containing protein n=1 Tax=Pyrrhoderma noxium TaxID=2282107 RepID=A0A286UJX1_9AGAM|nr:hypothetical protein PNOK_0469900 [Pyrrhoderma noxium]
MGEQDTAGLPKIVLDLVVDLLIQCRDPLPFVVEQEKPRNDGLVFRNLSLVHRSWISSARRGLWSRAIVDASDLNSYPQSAEHCSHLLELAFEENENESPEHDAWDQLAQVLQRSPNLKILYLDLDVPHDNFSVFLAQLRLQTSLETLWLSGDAEKDYNDLLLTVPALDSLKSLVIDCSDEEGVNTDSLSVLHSPVNLKAVAFTESVDWGFLPFLVRPNAKHSVTDLHLELDDEYLEMSPELKACLNSLLSLRISTSGTDAETELSIQKRLLNIIFSEVQSLQHLSLSVGPVLRTSELVLPINIRSFHIHHECFAVSACHAQLMLENDANIASVILDTSSRFTKEDRIQRLTLSFMGSPEEFERSMQEGLTKIFAKTQDACKQANITLVFRTYPSLYFAELAESPVFAGF